MKLVDKILKENVASNIYDAFHENILKEALLSDVYYHGTDTKEKAESILNNGLKSVKTDYTGNIKPMKGYTYLTKDLKFAIRHATWANPGSKPTINSLMTSQFCYVFKIKEIDDENVKHDEDELGELIYNQKIPELNKLAQEKLNPKLYNLVMDGDDDYWAKAGKQLNKFIIYNSPLYKQIFQHTKNIAYKGKLKITDVWEFDKQKNILLKQDCSNFFELATKIK